MRKILFCFLAILEGAAMHAQTNCTVTFTLKAPSLPDTCTVFVTGSAEELGGWNPGKVKLESNGGHVWSKRISFAQATAVEYKYTLGSWDREGARADGTPLPNFKASLSSGLTIADTIVSWTHGGARRVIAGQVTGEVHYHRGLEWAGLLPRDILVWLPPGYHDDPKARYPVFYMQDGQNIVDPATSAFGVDWRIDETMDSLIRSGAIPPAIVVGINNTKDRMEEYLPGTKGEAYLDFLVRRVKPLIDSAYRTKPDRGHTYIGGSSAGGILAFMAVWEHPDVFSRAICMSPAFVDPGKSVRWDYASEVEKAQKRKDVFFYIDNGGVGLDSVLQPGVNAMIQALNKKGYREGKEFTFIKSPGDQHFEAAWARRFPGAVLWIMKR